MRKTLTQLTLSAFFFLPFTYSQAQISNGAGAKVATYKVQSVNTHFSESPDLNHAHDGHHCLSDALTQDWVSSYGIEDEYREQELRQNQDAQQPMTARATYTIPIIFHVVYNPNNPSENVSEAAINNLLNAVNLDFTASNSDVGNLRSGFGL